MSTVSTLRMPAAACLLAGLLLPAAAGADETVCQGYDKLQRIERLGGANAFSKKPATSPAVLAELMNAHRDELESLMRERGLSDEVIAGLFAAVESGRGLSERQLERGEVFQWMTWRKSRSKQATTSGPMCMAATKTYDAYLIDVVIETPHKGDATCALKARGDCDGGTIKVDAGGSSPGVEVTMSGPGGSQVIIPGGSGRTTWQGPFDNRYKSDYSFSARAQARGPKTVRTYTFVVPKICLNLGFVGDKTIEVPAEGDLDTCTATARVDRCQATPPACNLSADPALVKVDDPVTVEATGHWASGGLSIEVVDDQGGVVQSLSNVPASTTFAKAGTYTVRGSATNEAGDKAPCNEVTLTVKRRSEWILRAYGAAIDADGGDVARTSRTLADGSSERTNFKLGDGNGAGVGVEYKFQDVVGIEGSLLYGELDTSFVLDIDDRWGMQQDDVGMLSFLVGPNFHLTRNSERVDFFVGPYVGFASFDDAEFSILGRNLRRTFDNEFVWGLQLGIDFSFGDSPWGLFVGGRYMGLSVETEGLSADDEIELDLDPLIFGVGFAYRF